MKHHNWHEDVIKYLTTRYNNSKRSQEKLDKQYDLTLEEFFSLWPPYIIMELTNWAKKGELLKRHGPAKVYCVTRESKNFPYNKDNCIIMRAKECKENGKMKTGERHREDSKQKMRVPNTPEQNANISKAKKGKKIGPQTEEHKAKVAAARKATWARKKAEKLAQGIDKN